MTSITLVKKLFVREVQDWRRLLDDRFGSMNESLKSELESRICISYIETYLGSDLLQEADVILRLEKHLKKEDTRRSLAQIKELVNPSFYFLIWKRLKMGAVERDIVANSLAPIFWKEFLDEYEDRISVLCAGLEDEKKVQIEMFAKDNQNAIGYRALIVLQKCISYSDKFNRGARVKFDQIAWKILLDQLAVALYGESTRVPENQWMEFFLDNLVRIRCMKNDEWNLDNKLYETLRSVWGDHFGELGDLEFLEKPLISIKSLIKKKELTVYLGHYLKSVKGRYIDAGSRNPKGHFWRKKMEKGRFVDIGGENIENSYTELMDEKGITEIIASVLYTVSPADRVKIICAFYFYDSEKKRCSYLDYLAYYNQTFRTFCVSLQELKNIEEGISVRGLTDFSKRRKTEMEDLFVADQMDIESNRSRVSQIHTRDFTGPVAERLRNHMTNDRQP